MLKFKYWFSVGNELREFIGTEKEFQKISEQFKARGDFVRVTKKKRQKS